MLMMLNFSVIIQLTFNMLWINFQIGCIILIDNFNLAPIQM